MSGYRITYTDCEGQRQETTAVLLDDVMRCMHRLRQSGATAITVERADLAEANDVRTVPQPKRGGWCW